MKYYKQVSGRGRVALSDDEVKKLFEKDSPIEEPASEIETLKNELSAMSKVMQKLCSNDFVAALLSVSEGKGDENGH